MRRTMLLGLTLALAACGSAGKDDAAALKAELAGNAADPAVKGAIEAPLLLDPQLTRESNLLAVKPADRPVDGRVPVLKGPAADDVEVEKLAGGRLMHAPDPTEAKPCPDCSGRRLTLGALARDMGQRQSPPRRCDAKLAYGMEWAQRLPAPFILYPRAMLTDAAGTNSGCALRGASFVATAPMAAVVDFYFTLARRAGFDAHHELIEGQHVLDGTRMKDGAAFFITFENVNEGGTGVNLIVRDAR